MDTIINFTSTAEEKIADIVIGEKDKTSSFQNRGVRLKVVGGGCSGLSYKIDFGEKMQKDNVQMIGDIQVFIDPKSSIYLKGTTLDYKDGLQGKGFIFVNPNATNTCGCGDSFAV